MRTSKILGFIPVFCVHLLLGWSYYVVVALLVGKYMTSTLQRVMLLVVYHASLVMLVWSYWRCILATPARPPAEFQLDAAELLSIVEDRTVPASVAERELPIYTRRRADGQFRVCGKCRLLKPDRAHHCSTCGQCVLKMDHHCPWVNNCVGWHNYKYFVQFLGYAQKYLLLLLLASLKAFVEYWRPHGSDVVPGQIIIVFFVALAFMLSVASLGGFHISLMLKNRTTLESYEEPNFVRPTVSGWRMRSARLNLEQVLGPFGWSWLVPTQTWTNNGVDFPFKWQPGDSSDHEDAVRIVMSDDDMALTPPADNDHDNDTDLNGATSLLIPK